MKGFVGKQELSSWGKKLGLIVAVWSGLALIPAFQAHAYVATLGRPITWRKALLPALLNHWIWAFLTPGVLWLSARYPIERRAWPRVIGIHGLGGVAFAVLHAAIRVPLYPAVNLYTTPPVLVSWRLFRSTLLANGYDDLWMYGTLVAISQLWDYYQKYKERELRASKLATQLAQAQLKVLKMQLNPHFLFNTLHAISSLMHQNVEAADNMITRLSDLLRLSLESVDDQEVTLKREMEFLEGYLEIQQTRFRDRLTVCMDVDPVTLDALVPNMILQPLVENAVTHGIAPRTTAGEIRIRAQRENGMLRLEVIDNGQGLPANLTEMGEKGLGLTNTQARLRQLYGEDYRFSLQRDAGGGAVVRLEIPFHLNSSVKDEGSSSENSSPHRG